VLANVFSMDMRPLDTVAMSKSTKQRETMAAVNEVVFKRKNGCQPVELCFQAVVYFCGYH
jgi:hypothetical protein